MCELKIVVNKKVVFEDVVYAKVTGNDVMVKSILGNSKVFNNYKITEVNITNEQLVLSSK
jgi:predicted RNA-binding protein